MSKEKVSKVFGIGLNKTGTTTLGRCLKILGYKKHLSHSEDFAKLYYEGRISELINIAKKYDSFEDWPWPLMYKELAVNFPDAKFILTLRKSDSVWLKSLITHSYKLPPEENYHEMIYGYKYTMGHKKYHLDFYNKHNEEVIEYFKDQPERLLVLCWENDDGWREICDFLGMKIPSKPFPNVGATKDWTVSKTRMLHNLLLAVKGTVARNQLNK
ncbi:MAG: sulfotransferase [Candidatus Saccharibacteria bacterium]|nr:sulfotransferase [Candidatus Saccharibacteria bacterium]